MPSSGSRAALAMFALALGASGCARDVAPDRYYRLREPVASVGADASPPAIHAGVLEVAPFAARGLLAVERHILVANPAEPARIRWHSRHLWSEAPARMVHSAVVQALRSSGVFEQTVTREQQARASHLLTGTVLELEHRRASEVGAASVSIAVEVTLTALGETRVVHTRRYAFEEPAIDPSVEAAVAALERALARVTAALVSDIRTVSSAAR